MPTYATLATPPMPGAVAIVELTGDDTLALLQQLTGVSKWIPSRATLVNFSDIDQGLAALLNHRHATLMPHAGPRVVQRLMQWLVQHGAQPTIPREARRTEAASAIESDMLDTLARAASPAAVDLLLAQPRVWRAFLNAHPGNESVAHISEKSASLDRLIHLPTVVLMGRPNVGKSTLTNAVIGRRVSIVADMPGTTRDFVTSLAEIDGVAFRWFDTPGVRTTPDPIESRAIELAIKTIASADALIVMRDDEHDWPSPDSTPRKPDLFVVSKCDRSSHPRSSDPPNTLRISSHTGAGIDDFLQAILAALRLSRSDRSEQPWAFSQTLRAFLQSPDSVSLKTYLT